MSLINAPFNLSLYAYAGNNPTNYVDQNGLWLESAWDALSLGIGVVSLVDNVQKGNWGSAAVDAGGVAIDALALVLPVVPGGAGAALKVARGADKLNDMRKAVDTGADAVLSSGLLDGRKTRLRDGPRRPEVIRAYGLYRWTSIS
ncbi:polymorphic toxin type 10 domain-containing protein [Sorangium sp. So ce1097]|uniref:polymorphic toxin type 10 domain-containing protein n=1 Tax=Sorangium sp. So ce1097 TaxID=3133330 RepID=UPI003F616D1F